MAEFNGWGFYTSPAVVVKAHPLIENARADVQKYRSQSPSHFALHIDVQAVTDEDSPHDNALGKDLKMELIFQDYSESTTLICRPFFHKKRKEVTNTVQVRRSGKAYWVSLKKELSLHFPPDSAYVTEDTMRHWWDQNGKSFNWTGLPTELKDQVLQYCVHREHGCSEYWHHMQDRRKLQRRKPGLYEIEDQLGEWRSLLRVSHPVRALVLRLVLERTDQYSGGLTIVSRSLPELKNTVWRLGCYYQLCKANGIPRNAREDASARRYKHFPKQYPHLFRFSTMAQGIRKLCLQFDYLELLHFFKVRLGSLHEYRGKKFMTCDVFDKLPNLDGLYIILPREWWIDTLRQMGPPIFHEIEPCPRTLHRLIYERAAEELAVYKNIHMTGFLDDFEEQRFWSLHESATLRLKFTPSELEELYAECGGGVQLETDEETEIDSERASGTTSYWSSTPSSNRSQKRYRRGQGERRYPRVGLGSEEDEAFPPRCECEVPCREVLFPS